jgi:hypothetical protein
MKLIAVNDPELDVSDFTNNIPKHKAVIMAFMMVGCPHCDMLKPKWESVKDKLAEDSLFNDVMVADIDSAAAQSLPLPNVMSFPSIKVMKGDKLHEYDGIREVDPLLSFLRKTVTTPVKHRRHTRHGHRRHHTRHGHRRHHTRHGHKRHHTRHGHRRHHMYKHLGGTRRKKTYNTTTTRHKKRKHSVHRS